jgi:hypothetical protein
MCVLGSGRSELGPNRNEIYHLRGEVSEGEVGSESVCNTSFSIWSGNNVTYGRLVTSIGNNLHENEIFMKTRNIIRGDMKHTVGVLNRLRYFFKFIMH